MAIFAGMQTFYFGDDHAKDAAGQRSTRPGIFSQVPPGAESTSRKLPDGMVLLAARAQVAKVVAENARPDRPGAKLPVNALLETCRGQGYGYGLLVVEGFLRVPRVGKSAQFPCCMSVVPTPWKAPRPSASALLPRGHDGRPWALTSPAAVFRSSRPRFSWSSPSWALITLFIAATIAITATAASAGLSTGQPVGLHDAGTGARRMAGRHVPFVHARLHLPAFRWCPWHGSPTLLAEEQ